jgi:hypothetical protein
MEPEPIPNQAYSDIDCLERRHLRYLHWGARYIPSAKLAKAMMNTGLYKARHLCSQRLDPLCVMPQKGKFTEVTRLARELSEFDRKGYHSCRAVNEYHWAFTMNGKNHMTTEDILWLVTIDTSQQP